MLNVLAAPERSGGGLTLLPNFIKEPRLRMSPVVVRRTRRDIHGFGGFFEGHADEITQFHQIGLGAVLLRQFVQGFVDFKNFVVVGRGGNFQFIELDVFFARAVADSAFATGFVDQNAPDGLSGGGEKMGAIGKRGIFSADQAEPRFMDQCGGLKSLIGSFPGHFGSRQLAQLVIDQWQQLVSSGGITLRNSFENACNVAQRTDSLML